MKWPEPEKAEKSVAPVPGIYQWLADQIAPFAPADGPPPRKLWPFLRWALRGAGTQITIAVLASIFVGVTTVIGMDLIGWVIDTARASGPAFLQDNFWQLMAIAGFYLVVWPGSLVLNAAFNTITLSPNLYALSLSRINRYTLGQALSYFDNDFAGRIAQKAQQTARALTDVVTEASNILGNAVAAAISAAIMLAAVDWRLGLAVVLWMAGYWVLLKRFIPEIRQRSELRAARRAVVTGQIVDTITNITTVKLFAHGAAEDQATEKALAGYRDSGVAWAGSVVTFRLFIFVLAGMLPTVLIGGTLALWSQGGATIGDVAAAGLISTRLAQMTGWVSFAALGIFSNIGEIEDGIRTLTPPHTITDRPAAAEPDRVTGGISFDTVSFGYGGAPGAALDRFSLDIRPGEKVALVGRSGAGKSTVMSLLLRLYDVEDGKVTLDGMDIRDMTQDSLRRQIAMVRQETSMFNRSARDNILYGRVDATEDEMIAAAHRASAHEFIQELKDYRGRSGYRAHLGERGVKLSGGQRQRIALARAILKDAPILVLDEATSALDSEVEAEIQDALAEVMDGKTVLAIAHRLSTIAAMDRIVVLDAGRIAEMGTHSELLARNGLYAKFWSHQSGGFLGEAAE